MSKIELKACPFCGCEPKHTVWGDDEYHRVECVVCDVGMDYFDSAAYVAECWNTRAPQWQPIESAPKDGTRILLFSDGDQVVAYFNVGYGTWDDGDHHDDIQGLTHWQPLPAPPEVEG